MLPAFKEVVEELFVRGLVKAVFATETLALGINMPARCVVLERLVKFNGEAHVDLTPGEYTQLTGRAGRRGIDVEGHAVVVWAPEVDPRHVAGLASTRTYPLRSSFRPSYNMAVNLVGSVGARRARELLESSFAQFQADRSVVGLARQVQRNAETMRGVRRPRWRCDRGDFAEYFELRMAIADRERAMARHGAAAAPGGRGRRRWSGCEIGDVIRVPSGRRAGLAVVLDPGVGGFGEPRPLVLTEDRWAGRLSGADFPPPVEALARVRVPKHFNHRSPAERRDLAAARRARTGRDRHGRAPGRPRPRARGDDRRARRAARARCASTRATRCPDREEHARWAERRCAAGARHRGAAAQGGRRTGSLARTFDQVCALLTDARLPRPRTDGVTDAGPDAGPHLDRGRPAGRRVLRRGVWDGLAPAELAAAVSVVVFEARREAEDARRCRAAGRRRGRRDPGSGPSWRPTRPPHGLQLTREPDLGFVWPIYRWARGEPLSKVLASGHSLDGDMPAGDFVRWARQVIDLLGQIAEAAGAAAACATTRAAGDRAVNRGVLAYTAA